MLNSYTSNLRARYMGGGGLTQNSYRKSFRKSSKDKFKGMFSYRLLRERVNKNLDY